MLISRHCLWVAAVALASAGCSSQTDDLPREPVSGKVTLDGKPLATGMITFTPTGGTEPSRPETVVTALIQDGAYSLPRAQGPIPGPHSVSIWSKQPTGKKLKDPDNPGELIDEMREVVPPDYNLRTTLTAKVEAGGKNTFDFDLTTKGAPQAKR